MMAYKEPCMCGGLDCVRCYGEDAKYVGACERCPYDSICQDAPSLNCRYIQELEEAAVEAKLDARSSEW